MPEIKLPFGEAVKRSLAFAFNHWEAFFKISLVWALLISILDAVEGFPSLCVSGAQNCPSDSAWSLYVWGMFFSGISVVVSYTVYVIERKEYKSYFNLRFGKKDFKYIWAMIKLLFAGIAVSMITGFILGGLMSLLGQGSFRQTSMFFAMISFFFVGMFLSRYALVFPAIALENSEIGFEKSFALTKGNINAIFWGTVVMSLPMTVLNLIVAGLYFALGIDNVLLKFIFSFVLVMISLFNDAMKASFMAHVYQYFIYFYDKYSSQEKAE